MEDIVTADVDRYGAVELRNIEQADKITRPMVVVITDRLPANHPARQVLPTDDLVLGRDPAAESRDKTTRLLLLGEPGPDGLPLASYPAAEAAAVTKAIAAARMAKREAFRERLEAGGYEELGHGGMQKYAADWPEGQDLPTRPDGTKWEPGE